MAGANPGFVTGSEDSPSFVRLVGRVPLALRAPGRRAWHTAEHSVVSREDALARMRQLVKEEND